MRDTIKGACIGAFVAAAVSVLLAQTTPSWTSPRTWATDDLLTASQFNAQIRDNLLNIRGFAACAENGTTGTSSAGTVLYGDCRWDAAASVTIAELGCTGTRNSSTVLFGDCTWAELPTQYALSLNTGSTTTTSTTYVNVGNAATIGGTSGDVKLYLSGGNNPNGTDTACELRLRNTTTSTTVFEEDYDGGIRIFRLLLLTDTSPSATTDNTYQMQLRVSTQGTSGSVLCGWQVVDIYQGLMVFLDA